MQLRRRVGNRELPTFPLETSERPKSVRRVAFACFRCRVSVKRVDGDAEWCACARCGGAMLRMGWSFKAPARKHGEQWLVVAVLFAQGFRFEGSGGSNAVPLPKRLRDVEDFLSENPDHPLRLYEPLAGSAANAREVALDLSDDSMRARLDRLGRR